MKPTIEPLSCERAEHKFEPKLVEVPHCIIGTRGLTLEENVGFEDWVQVGRRLLHMTGCVQFWIGDFINFGEERFADRRDVHGQLVRREHGEKYKEALRLFEYDYGTLRDMAWVAQSVHLSRRRDKLSWMHHREVAALDGDAQEHWLGLAEIGTDGKRWSVSELRQRLRASNATQPPEPDGGGIGVGFKKKVDDCKRAIKQLLEASPVEQWSKEQREAMKEELDWLVKFATSL